MATWSMQELVNDAYKNNEFTDLSLKFGDSAVRVHKLVICKQSPVFKAMCQSGFKESETAVIDLSNDSELDEIQFQCLIDFMYGFKYACESEASATPPRFPMLGSARSSDQTGVPAPPRPPQAPPLFFGGPAQLTGIPPAPPPIRSLFGGAPYVSIPPITQTTGSLFAAPISTSSTQIPPANFFPHAPSRSAAGNDFSRLFQTPTAATPSSSQPRLPFVDARGNRLSLTFHARMYATGDRYDIRGLSKYAQTMYQRSLAGPLTASISDFLDSVVVVYTTTPDSDRGLRDVAVSHIKNNLGGMKDMKARIREIVMEVPSFAADVFDLLY